MGLFKKKQQEPTIEELNNPTPEETANDEANPIDDDEFNPYDIELVVERIQAGLIGTIKVGDELLNKPMFKKDDLVYLRAPSRLQKGDFVLYLDHEEYPLRRIIKFVNEDIYVAGDNERGYHIIHKDDVVAKAVGRQRKKKYLSFSLVKKKRIYVFTKVNLAGLRLGNRIITHDDDLSNEAYEAALANQQVVQQQKQPEKPIIATNIDLDSDLASFLNPDDLVKELRAAQKAEEVVEEEEEIYVDEEGNPLTPEQIEAIRAQEAEADLEVEGNLDTEPKAEKPKEDKEISDESIPDEALVDNIFEKAQEEKTEEASSDSNNQEEANEEETKENE